MRRFLANLHVFPFAEWVALLAILAGAAGLFHVGGLGADPLSGLVASWVASFLSGLYLLAGLALWVGLGTAQRRLETFALIVIAVAVLVRAVAVVYGLASASPGVPVPVAALALNTATNLLLLRAVLIRLITLVRGDVVVAARRTP